MDCTIQEKQTHTWKAELTLSLVPNVFISSHTDLGQWSESASELYRPSDRRLSAKLVSTFADRGCRVVSVTDPYGCIIGLLDQDAHL
jgi:hypothetical protein